MTRCESKKVQRTTFRIITWPQRTTGLLLSKKQVSEVSTIIYFLRHARKAMKFQYTLLIILICCFLLIHSSNSNCGCELVQKGCQMESLKDNLCYLWHCIFL